MIGIHARPTHERPDIKPGPKCIRRIFDEIDQLISDVETWPSREYVGPGVWLKVYGKPRTSMDGIKCKDIRGVNAPKS